MDCGQLWKNLKPIVCGSIFLILIFMPVILSSVLLHINSKENVFIYYQNQEEHSNNLDILQVIFNFKIFVL
jgi:hypothetical protein